MNKFYRLLLNLIPVFFFLAIVYFSTGSMGSFNQTNLGLFDSPSASSISGFGTFEQKIFGTALLFLLFLMIRSSFEKKPTAN